MLIDRVEIYRTEIPLNQPFRTSFGEIDSQSSIVVKVFSDGATGYGEACPFLDPLYSYECIATMLLILKDYVVPAVLGKDIVGVDDYLDRVAFIRGHNHAKAALETAIWDLRSRTEGKPLWRLLGGTRERVEVGVSIGLQPTPDDLCRKIAAYLEQGYRRIKIKIEPSSAFSTLEHVRSAFPDITLMVDANSAFSVGDIEALRQLDRFGLIMVEQPLAEDDIVDHAALQAKLKTPVCLDESIHSPDDARRAAALGSCRIINIKYGRVGGLARSVAIHDLCRAARIANWAGGMIETGIGQRFKIALASLPNFTYAADIETSDRFLTQDLVVPDIVQRQGFLESATVYDVDEEKLRRFSRTIDILKA